MNIRAVLSVVVLVIAVVMTTVQGNVSPIWVAVALLALANLVK